MSYGSKLSTKPQKITVFSVLEHLMLTLMPNSADKLANLLKTGGISYDSEFWNLKKKQTLILEAKFEADK